MFDNLSKDTQKIISCIPTGINNQKHIKEISSIYGYSRGQIQRAVKEARDHGVLVISGLSGNGGLYRPDLRQGPHLENEIANIRHFIKDLRDHGESRLITADIMSGTLESMNIRI